MTEEAEIDSHALIMRAAADILEGRPYETVTLHDIADAINITVTDVAIAYPSMHELGSAILTHEGNSMRAAQRRAFEEARDGLDRLRLAFRYVGENLAGDNVVRAGVRIAGESHLQFPERNINPFRTWHRFIANALDEARGAGDLRNGTSSDDAAWLLTAAGLGTKDLLSFTRGWAEAPELLERVAQQVISILRAAPETDTS